MLKKLRTKRKKREEDILERGGKEKIREVVEESRKRKGHWCFLYKGKREEEEE
jgi:hypothetical protein